MDKLYIEFENGKEVKRIATPLTPEEEADKTETDAITKAGTLIDAIANLSDAKVFLKRLCQRLIKNGYLP